MKFSDIMGLLGGLALFWYGMQMMGSGLEAAAAGTVLPCRRVDTGE